MRKLRNTILTLDNLQPESASQSPFFQVLPPEIRDLIFHHLWEETPRLHQRYKYLKYTVSYGAAHPLLATERPQVCPPASIFTAGINFSTSPVAAGRKADAGRGPHRVPSAITVALRNHPEYCQGHGASAIVPDLAERLCLPDDRAIDPNTHCFHICSHRRMVHPSPILAMIATSTENVGPKIIHVAAKFYKLRGSALAEFMNDLPKFEALKAHSGVESFRVTVRAGFYVRPIAVPAVDKRFVHLGKIVIPGGVVTKRRFGWGLTWFYIDCTVEKPRAGIPLNDERAIVAPPDDELVMCER